MWYLYEWWLFFLFNCFYLWTYTNLVQYNGDNLKFHSFWVRICRFSLRWWIIYNYHRGYHIFQEEWWGNIFVWVYLWRCRWLRGCICYRRLSRIFWGGMPIYRNLIIDSIARSVWIILLQLVGIFIDEEDISDRRRRLRRPRGPWIGFVLFCSCFFSSLVMAIYFRAIFFQVKLVDSALIFKCR